MIIYEQQIKAYEELFQNTEMDQPKSLCCSEQVQWEDAGKQNMILRSEMAYELGGGIHQAISDILFTDEEEVWDAFTKSIELDHKGKDHLILFGPDLSALHEDSSYARITLVKLKNHAKVKEQQELYRNLREIEYTKFHVNPKGYMMRISSASHREPVRVSKEAIEAGLTFTQVGNLFLNAYHKQKEVEAVVMIFITMPDFPYVQAEKIMEKTSLITESLNTMFHNLKMDCSVCRIKPICDEVDGMRQLHKASLE